MQWLLRDHHFSSMPEVHAGAMPATPPANVGQRTATVHACTSQTSGAVPLLYAPALDHAGGEKPAYCAVAVSWRACHRGITSSRQNLLVSPNLMVHTQQSCISCGRKGTPCRHRCILKNLYRRWHLSVHVARQFIRPSIASTHVRALECSRCTIALATMGAADHDETQADAYNSFRSHLHSLTHSPTTSGRDLHADHKAEDAELR